MHKTVRALRRGLACDVSVEACDKPLAHLAMLRRDLIAVALEEPGVQLADQRLVHRRLAVEPVGVRHRAVAEQRCVHPAQFRQRQHGLFDCRAAYFVADDGRTRVAKQQVEGARLGVESGVMARRDRPVKARCDVGVEPHLAFVQAEREARLPAHGVGGGDLEHHRIRAVVAVRVGQPDAVALAHLAGADALEREVAHRYAQSGGEPLDRQIGRPLHDVSGAHWCWVCGTCPAASRPRPATGCGRRTRTA